MKDTDISPAVRKIVRDREERNFGWTCCIYCGYPYRVEIAHYVPRSRGGKGIPENLVCLCPHCHRHLDNGSDIEYTRSIKRRVESYLREQYPDWDKIDLGGRR